MEVVMAAPKGLHHIGVPVRSIERSLAWYRDIFGLEPSFVALSEGPVLDRTVGLENARLRYAMLELADAGCRLELIEYESPIGEDFALRNCDVGATHICFEVDDIDAVYDELRAKGVAFSVEPSQVLGGVLEGDRYCYFRDPDGIQLELWERA
jgi:catechol 2,3-dioxygenase-like lactoylglutathione lyase family enzyme